VIEMQGEALEIEKRRRWGGAGDCGSMYSRKLCAVCSQRWKNASKQQVDHVTDDKCTCDANTCSNV
jgi:hypothetical protein